MPEVIYTFQRKEMKFVLNQEDFDFLFALVSEHMDGDTYPHYRIRSWYYDTPSRLVARENEGHPKYKAKLRYRIYVDAEKSPQFLEMKSKLNGVTYKRRIKVHSFEGALEEAMQGESQIAKEIAYFIKTHPGLKPSLAITYDRFAFHDDHSDLRITFDRDVFAGVVPLVEPNQYILEVKTSVALPWWLIRGLESRGLYRRSFSKFATGNKVSSAIIDASEADPSHLKYVGKAIIE